MYNKTSLKQTLCSGCPQFKQTSHDGGVLVGGETATSNFALFLLLNFSTFFLKFPCVMF